MLFPLVIACATVCTQVRPSEPCQSVSFEFGDNLVVRTERNSQPLTMWFTLNRTDINDLYIRFHIQNNSNQPQMVARIHPNYYHVEVIDRIGRRRDPYFLNPIELIQPTESEMPRIPPWNYLGSSYLIRDFYKRNTDAHPMKIRIAAIMAYFVDETRERSNVFKLTSDWLAVPNGNVAKQGQVVRKPRSK